MGGTGIGEKFWKGVGWDAGMEWVGRRWGVWRRRMMIEEGG